MAQNVTAMMKLLQESRAWHLRVTQAPINTLGEYELDYRKRWDALKADLAAHMDAEFDRAFGTLPSRPEQRARAKQ